MARATVLAAPSLILGVGAVRPLQSASRREEFKNNHFTEMCCGTEAGSYLRLIDSCITQLKDQGPSRTCDESREEEGTIIGIGL